MIDFLVKLTRPTIKKLLKLYMTNDFGNNKTFTKEVSKIFNITEDESHLIWQILDVSYEYWFLRKSE